MARAFAITTAGDQISLDQQGNGEITYTVSNTTTRPLRAWPRIKGLGSTDESWVSVVSGGERSFSPGESHQFVVKVNVPANAPTGRYSFRLNVISGSREVEDESIEGPAVSFEVKPAPTVPPRREFPWRLVAVAGVVVLVGGITIAWLLRTVPIPSVVGMSRQAAQQALEDAGLTLGKITSSQRWAPQDHVLEQFPSGESRPVAAGTAVDLVVANSQYTFRSTRILSKPEGTTTITAEYKVMQTLDIDTGKRAGEFTLQEVDISGSTAGDDWAGLNFVVSQLVRTRGNLKLDALDNTMDFESTNWGDWEAFRSLVDRFKADAEKNKKAIELEKNERRAGADDFGKFIGIALVAVEVGFDLKAIFHAVSTDAGNDVEGFHLQRGGFSTIRVEDPGKGSTTADSIRRLSVVRRVKDADPFEKIGLAEYDAGDGLLKRLDIRTEIEGQSYRTIIEQL
jgi:hypothetical protein